MSEGLQPNRDPLSDKVIGLAIEIHRTLGPGLDTIHQAQLLTYLRLNGKKVGLLLNFNETLLKNGILRRVL